MMMAEQFTSAIQVLLKIVISQITPLNMEVQFTSKALVQ